MGRIENLRALVRDRALLDAAGRSDPWADRTPLWAEPCHEAWRAHEGCEFPLRLAHAQAAEMAAARPYILPDELIIGGNRLRPIVSACASPFGNGLRLDAARAEELKRLHPDKAGEIEGIVSHWREWLSGNPDRLGSTCHASLGYERILTLGVAGLHDHVAEWRDRNVPHRPECGAWYDALLVVLDGVSAFIEAHAAAADGAAEAAGTPERREELRRVADACRRVSHAPPDSFHEAVQLYYLMFLLCGHDSPGPVDRHLYPALKRDLESGAITRDAAQGLVDCLWCKFEEKTAYGATLGGQLRDGSDATNEASFLCLNAIRRLRLLSPRTAVRWHPRISREFFAQACDTVAEGASFPAFVNDEAVIAAAVARGETLEDAREYSFVGCGQVYPHARGHGNYEDVIVHCAKALELALHDGTDPVTGRQAGPHTGPPAEFADYAAFERAYRTQLDAVIEDNIRSVNERRAATRGRACNLLRSLLTYSCVERGLDWHAGGADYSEGMVDLVGMATVTDSLVAIKMGVYEQGIVSLPQLIGILDRNWEGQEPLRQRFLRRLPKFGNGSPEADGMAAAEIERLNRLVQSHQTCFGGPWGIDIIGWSASVTFGEQTGATPDGRRAREPVADCAGPAQGRNVRGLTQTLESVALLPHDHAHGPLALSLRFARRDVQDADGRAKLRAAIESYFRMGGQQLQVSVAGTEEMIAAQKNPEAHRSLIVRVGGFSAYFVEMEKRWQDDMIARSEMDLR